MRLLNRTTRSVAPTEAGAAPARAARPGARRSRSGARCGQRLSRPAGRHAAAQRAGQRGAAGAARASCRRSSPPIPDIRLEVIAEESFVDVLAAGCDAGIRYDERLEQDMIAVPIGPRSSASPPRAAPAYLDRHGRPEHPRDLLGHACLRGRFPSGAMPAWEFERDGEVVQGRPDRPADRAASAARPISPSTRRSPAPASSICSRTGCARISTAARWSRCWNRGGSASPGRSSTIPAAASCPRRCARSSISSRHRLARFSVLQLRHRLRRRPPRDPPRENAAAEERAFERAVAVHAAAAEARDLAGRIEAGQRRAVALQHARG